MAYMQLENNHLLSSYYSRHLFFLQNKANNGIQTAIEEIRNTELSVLTRMSVKDTLQCSGNDSFKLTAINQCFAYCY